MPLPPQKVLLTVTQNKIQLIDLIVAALQKEKDHFKLCIHKLVVTGREPVTVEINKGLVIRRCDLKTVQEEADIIMIQQMIAISEELDGAGIRVMCDDTDVFVLLLLLMSEPFDIERGVLQGDIFSPVSFIAGLDRIFRRHDISNSGVTVGTGENTVCVSKLEYADDAALIDENVEQASARVTSNAKGSLEEAAMVISIRKSKVMHVHTKKQE